MNYLFVTGMFRSGTTLMAKIMDAHPEISFSSDPYRPFFNDFRDSMEEMNGIPSKSNNSIAPLSSYFCDDDDLKLTRLIQDADLNHKIDAERLNVLKPVLALDTLEEAPRVVENIEKLKGETYKDLYDSMMELVHECYGKKDAKIWGHKEVWTTEFVPALTKTFPNMKSIAIVRDPRAVLTSKYVKNDATEKYPWLFLIRQWRKLAILTWVYSQDEALKNNFLYVRYEDLVENPESVCKKMCTFIGLDYSSDMIDGSKFQDGVGKNWTQNSSHGTGGSISKNFTQRWKEVLTSEQVDLIEKLCHHEMNLFGYTPVGDNWSEVTMDDVLNPHIVPEEELARWIRNYSNTDPIFNSVEMMKEYTRSKIPFLESADQDLSEDTIQSFFTDKRHFDHLKKTLVSEKV